MTDHALEALETIVEYDFSGVCYCTDDLVCKPCLAVTVAFDAIAKVNAAAEKEAEHVEALLSAAVTLLASLKWEEERSGTTYAGAEALSEAVARLRVSDDDRGTDHEASV